MQSSDFSHFRVPIKLQGRFKSTNSAAMIDSGATGLFLHQRFADRHRIFTRRLPHPITLYNIDGTPNEAGKITHSARLLSTIDHNDHPQLLEYLITNLGSEDIILGLPWLRKVNPAIDWKKGQLIITTPTPACLTIEEEPEPCESNIGGTADSLLEPNPEYVPLPPPDEEELLQWKDNNRAPLYWLMGN